MSHRDYPGKEVKVYALLDDASDTTFVTNQVKKELGVPGVETNLSLSTMHGRRVISVSRIDGLTDALRSTYQGHIPKKRFRRDETRFRLLR